MGGPSFDVRSGKGGFSSHPVSVVLLRLITCLLFRFQDSMDLGEEDDEEDRVGGFSSYSAESCLVQIKHFSHTNPLFYGARSLTEEA